jgi:colicin import membrane protein
MDGSLWSLYQRQAPRFQLTRGMMVSILAHVLVAITAIVVTGLQPRRSIQVPYYSVDLVSLEQAGLNDGGSMGGSGKKSASPAPAQTKSHHALPVVPVERLRTQNLAEPVAPLKKLDAPTAVDKTTNSSAAALDKTLDKLIAKPKQAPESTSPQPKAPGAGDKAAAAQSSGHEGEPKATQGSDNKGAETGPGAGKGASRDASASTGEGAGSPSGGGADSGAIGLARRLYYTEVWNAVRREWALDTSRLKGQHLVATVVLVVRRDGKILSYRFEKKSGNALLDESAERAVRKVDTLPPFPKIYSPNQEEIGIHFRPEDLS